MKVVLLGYICFLSILPINEIWGRQCEFMTISEVEKQIANIESPSKKIEMKIPPGFESENEPVIGGLFQLYIKLRLDAVLRLMELRK